MIIKNKLKTITFSVFFAEEKNQKTEMYRFLLANTLHKTNDEFKSAKLFSKTLESFYDAFFSIQSFEIKNYNILMYNFTFVHPTYVIEENFYDEVFDFFYKTIFNRKTLSKTVFDYEKRKIIEHYETILDNKNSYARERFLNEFYRDERNYKQKLKALKAVELDNVYNYYNEMFETNIIDYYISGDLTEEMINKFQNKFTNSNKTLKLKHKLISKRTPKTVIEKKSTKQALIYLGYNLSPFTKSKNYEALILMDLYIGGFSDSNLFKVIREEMGLCYSIRSVLNVNKATLIVYAGVNNGTKDKALEAITNLVESLKTKEITDEELMILKNYYIHSYKQARDNQVNVLRSTYINNKLGRNDNLNAKIKKILNVKKTDIQKYLKMLTLDTTYILEEELEKTQ